MFQLLHSTPFETAIGLYATATGENVASAVVKATFSIGTDGALTVAPCQQPVRMVDDYYQDVTPTTVRYPIDLVPDKASTDIGIVGSAFAPRRRAQRAVAVRVKVGKSVAERIVDIDSREGVLRPFTGFGFLAPQNPQRLKFGGTYDDTWARKQCPLPPVDLRREYFSCGGSGMAIPGHLQGDEMVLLENLTPDLLTGFRLPRTTVIFRYALQPRQVERTACLWTVVIEPERREVQLTWGSVLALGHQPSRLRDVTIRFTRPSTSR